jgi:hypothetical protein
MSSPSVSKVGNASGSLKIGSNNSKADFLIIFRKN